MLAFLQAQQRLQQQGHPHQANGKYLQQQQHNPYQQQQHGQQRPGGDADVASFLLKLRTNQNGEPTIGPEAEALQQLNAAAAARNAQSLQQQLPLSQAPVAASGIIPGYPSIASMAGMNHIYPGMVGFPQANTNAFQNFYNPMQSQMVMAQGLAPMQRPGGVIPGMNHSQSQPHSGTGMQAPAPVDTGPTMTDEYIESLVSNDAEAKKSDSKETSSSENADEKSKESSSRGESPSKDTKSVLSANDDINIALVLPKDRDLIPDALFVALGQMRPCRLQQSDRVGCYKTRALGFLGMCCKHCGGQPGFGRYFPNSVRSLAQTTTSQTILKHIGGKCRFCPQNVRTAVLELQRQQAHKEHLSTGRPRYGSRKIFFQKMWTRLHGPPENGEGAKVVQADVTPERAKEEAEAAERANSSKTSTLKETSDLPATTTNTASSATNKTPSPVSNNNSDDEGPPALKGGSGDIGISLKRKLAEDDKEGENKESNDKESDSKKKARVSPVAI